MRRAMFSLSVVFALVACVGTAGAEETGPVGSLARLDVNTTSADRYLQYHGRIFVRSSKTTLDEYRWGGTSCGTRVLTEAHVAALQRVLDNKKMTIEPLSQDGQGSTKCLVGFALVEKKNLALFP